MTLPLSTIYKDINSETEFSNFTLKAIEVYLEPMGKMLDSTAKLLYTNRFLKYLRLGTENEFFYVKSECHAEMKRKITYKIDICINKERTIMEAQCECAAGMGPNAHCKHVCAVLYGMSQFSACKEVRTEETCTQRLQTFHQCKPFSGSPIKAKNLPTSNEGLDVCFDPRPQEFRNLTGYNDFFRNICLNHPNISAFPISHLFEPANPYAIALDHDYFKLSPEYQWLKENKLFQISDEDIATIQEGTVGQSKSKLWASERCKRLTSSNFGRICKATDRTDFSKLALSFTSTYDIHTAAIKHGRQYEPVALEKYESVTSQETLKCGIFVSNSYPFLAASPDGLAENDKLIEIKCPYTSRNELVSPETVPYLTEVNGQLHLDKKHDYYYQIQGQMLCTGKQSCDFFVYTFKDYK